MCASSYKKSGVDIDKADSFIDKIKPLVKTTKRPEVLGGLGGFSGLFKPDLKEIKSPVFVSSTDGVGTKLLNAEFQTKFDTIGIDLVAMCVNDIIVAGAEPLFFLDYLATGRLNNKKMVQVIKGIVEGCRQARCALIGGETAELPGMYDGENFDLAGFCVGIVDQEKIISGEKVKPGDSLIGLASSGLHSNGFSLVRNVLTKKELKGDLGKQALTPTRIYVKSVLESLKKITINAMAHITGGGFYDNLPRMYQSEFGIHIKKGSWPVPEIFSILQHKGKIDDHEMYRTFNMGIGLVCVVRPQDEEKTIRTFKKLGEDAFVLGEIIKGKKIVTISS